MKKIAIVSVLALSSLLAATSHAESRFVVGTGNAAANLNFKVVIPRVLFLGVGSGAANLATGGTTDTLTFDYTSNPADIGTTGTAAGSITNDGGFSGSVVPVKVFGNGGQIMLTASNPTALVGTVTATDTIPFAQISATTGAAGLPVPAFGGNSSPVLTAGKVTNQTADWTFAYANAVTPAAGTYTATVTYTASMP